MKVLESDCTWLLFNDMREMCMCYCTVANYVCVILQIYMCYCTIANYVCVILQIYHVEGQKG